MNQEPEIVQFQGAMELKPLVRDYLLGASNLDHLYTHPCNAGGVQNAADERLKTFSAAQRALLTKSLHAQYVRDCGKVSPSIEASIQQLEAQNTATITTGHQLNIAGGPLFFVYKVAAVVKMAQELNRAQSNTTFIPVFWMASEDHDLEEIDHFKVNDRLFQWKTQQSGAVGRMKTEQLATSLEAFFREAGLSHANASQLLKKVYSQPTLASAHRLLVHELFTDHPILVIDGDDVALKQSFAPVIERELAGPWLMDSTREAVDFLNTHYHVQVNPRPCNLFYLNDGIRERIDAPENYLDSWRENPASISPNALIRPLYQEWILPNAAYVGGPAEVAYWLQLKGAFDHISLPFPALCLRPSFVLIDEKWDQKREKLGLSRSDTLQKSADLHRIWVASNGHFPVDFSALHGALEEQFNRLSEVAHQTDPSFTGALRAQEKKQKKGLENLQKRWLKAEKRRHAEVLRHIEQLQDPLFERGVPVERVQSLWHSYAQFGPSFIAQVIQAAPAFQSGVVFLSPSSSINP